MPIRITIIILSLLSLSNLSFAQSPENEIIVNDTSSMHIMEDEDKISGALYVDQEDDSTSKGVSPTGALFRSLLIPGWGQLSNKKYIKAGIVITAEVALIGSIVHYAKKASDAKKAYLGEEDETEKIRLFAEYQDAENDRSLFGWYLGTLIFLSMFDAFVDAHLADFPKKNEGLSLNISPRENEIVGLRLSYYF